MSTYLLRTKPQGEAKAITGIERRLSRLDTDRGSRETSIPA